MSETPLAGRFDGEGCGCDGSRPCGEDMPCQPAEYVPCEECERRGTDDCNYPYDRISDGCYFPIKEATK